MPEAQSIAYRVFTKTELKALRNLPDSQKLEGFFINWVCKEAYLKALGDGLANALDIAESIHEDPWVALLDKMQNGRAGKTIAQRFEIGFFANPVDKEASSLAIR